MMFITGCAEQKSKNIDVREEKKEDIDIRNVANEDIVYTFGPKDAFIEYVSHFSNPAEYAEESDEVIYGEVTDIQYRVGGGERGAEWFGEAYVKVKVIQSLKGSYQEGDTITVIKDQGIFTVKDYIDNGGRLLDEKIIEGYSEDEFNQIYVQQIHDNDVMAEIGQKGVYFLEKSERHSIKQPVYYRLSWPLGEYAEVLDNCFVKVSHLYDELNPPYRLNELQKTKDEFYKVYTLEEIVSLIK